MKVYDWITAHPDEHLRIIRYDPAPDVIDEHGNYSCGGEGTSTTVFDSTTGEGDLSALLLVDITTVNEGDDGIQELEFLPDEYCISY